MQEAFKYKYKSPVELFSNWKSWWGDRFECHLHSWKCMFCLSKKWPKGSMYTKQKAVRLPAGHILFNSRILWYRTILNTMLSSVRQNKYQPLESNRVFNKIKWDLVVLSVKYRADVRCESTAIPKSFTTLVRAISVECLHLNSDSNCLNWVNRWALSWLETTFFQQFSLKRTVRNWSLIGYWRWIKVWTTEYSCENICFAKFGNNNSILELDVEKLIIQYKH